MTQVMNGLYLHMQPVVMDSTAWQVPAAHVTATDSFNVKVNFEILVGTLRVYY